MITLVPKVRSAVTLGVLGVVLLIGASWGWSAVTEPFPESEDAPVCADVAVSEGSRVFRRQVTVSVLNAGDSAGLAGRTFRSLADRGFVTGDVGDAPEDADVPIAQIWTDEPRSPDVRLVARHLPSKPRIVDRPTVAPGVNLVVGDDFSGVTRGPKAVRAKIDATICSPAEDAVPAP